MKNLILVIFASAVISICSVAASAQVVRIHFAPGQTSKVVSGTLTGYKSHKTFVIYVKKGQTLTTEAVKKYITISIKAPPGSTYEPDLAADCHDKNDVSPTARGDYKITVTECLKADPWRGTFKFRVTVN